MTATILNTLILALYASFIFLLKGILLFFEVKLNIQKAESNQIRYELIKEGTGML
jgi:hypothetical protein